MGYCSDVAIRCQAGAFSRLSKIIRDYEIEPEESYIADNEFVVVWSCVRWYDGYDYVEAIRGLFDELDEEHDEDKDDELGYKFLRIGEDDSDIEQRGNDYNIGLYVRRTFDIYGLREVPYEQIAR